MPEFEVLLHATLEGATAILTTDDYCFRVGFQCGKCRSLGAKPIVFSRHDRQEIPDGKNGECQVLFSCKECKAQANVSIVPAAGVARGEAEALEKGGAVIGRLECRGTTPVKAELGPGFTVQGPSGASWPVDFSEGDWCEYDEAAETSLTVSDVSLTVRPLLRK